MIRVKTKHKLENVFYLFNIDFYAALCRTEGGLQSQYQKDCSLLVQHVEDPRCVS